MAKKKTSPVAIKPQEPVQLTFPQGLNEVLDGKKITRVSWNDDSLYVHLKDGWLMYHKEDGNHQLLVSESDLVGIDWIVIEVAN